VSADSLTEEELNWHKEELNRQRLMDAAAACIAERGIAKTRMGNIAEQSGMARQTIYNYYSSREELLGATLLREGMGVAEQVAREIRDYESLEDKFVAAFMCGLREFPANPLLSRLLQDATYRGKVGLTPELFQVAGEASMREVASQGVNILAFPEEALTGCGGCGSSNGYRRVTPCTSTGQAGVQRP